MSTLEGLADLMGVPVPALRLMTSILLGFPLALVHRHCLYGKSATLQHLFFITSGLSIGFWNYGWNSLHSAQAVCATYLILLVFGGTLTSTTITFIFNMGYLLYGYWTTSTDVYDIVWTMPQCVLTLRLIGLAFNLWDGTKMDESLSIYQKKVALCTCPSFLEVAAYVYFPGSFLVGPQFSMRRYLDYVNGTLIENGDDLRTSCLVAGIKRAIVGFIYVAFFQIGTIYVSDQYLLGDEYRQQNFFKKCFLIGLWGRINLYKYISCWLITEGVCITFGLPYNGRDKDGSPKWDGCSNVALLTFENATTFDHYIMSFNKNTNHWCAEYIYKRLKFLGSRIFSQVVTLLFLAVWHGFHSGYYLCFLMEFLIMYWEKDIGPVLMRHEKLQKCLKENLALRVLVWVILKMYTFVFMGYALIPFVLMSSSRYIPVFGSIYYCGHVLFLSYPLVAPFIKRTLKASVESRSRAHQE
ncbi:lysophospholipid acyltransferase 5 isoform X2 [Venturia canescens]|nr:lysophospholipid acyltransferase 5 isoform X2 [Venturia canescens]